MKRKKITTRTLITAKMLRDAGACEYEVKRFKRAWPKGTRITKKSCLRAGELSFDFHWFIKNFLPLKSGRKWTNMQRGAYFDRNLSWSKYTVIAVTAFYQVVKEAK